jgi:hypothetical protein
LLARAARAHDWDAQRGFGGCPAVPAALLRVAQVEERGLIDHLHKLALWTLAT